MLKWIQYRFGVEYVLDLQGKRFTRQVPGMEGRAPDFNLARKTCLWCHQKFPASATQFAAPNTENMSLEASKTCPTCGWSASTLSWTDSTRQNEFYADPGEMPVVERHLGQHAVLRKFSINDRENVSLRELGTFLRRHFTDATRLSPRRMEELVEDVFKQHGYRTRLTAQTRDGGADILFLDADGGVDAIVEVKRYSSAVGIALVQRVVGAIVSFGARRAYVVTTSRFTSPARNQEALVAQNGYSLELWDGQRLLRELDVYREDLPNPDVLKPAVIPIANPSCGEDDTSGMNLGPNWRE